MLHRDIAHYITNYIPTHVSCIFGSAPPHSIAILSRRARMVLYVAHAATIISRTRQHSVSPAAMIIFCVLAFYLCFVWIYFYVEVLPCMCATFWAAMQTPPITARSPCAVDYSIVISIRKYTDITCNSGGRNQININITSLCYVQRA